MSNLRLLIIDELHSPNALNRVPDGLRHLSWKFCSLKCLPSSFQPKEIVELDLSFSKCEYPWEGAKCLGKLKSINLSFSKNLIRTPDFSGVTRLEILGLEECTNLVGLHPSIGQLSKLKSLDLSYCKSLTNLPSLLAKMESFTSIDLFGCSKIKKIPEFKGTMKSLSRLILGWTAIEEVPPSSTDQLSKLEALDLSLCKKLRSLSELPSTMRYINMESCCSLEPSPVLLRQSSLSRPYSSPFFRGYDESSGGVVFTILNRYLQGLFCQKTGYKTATKRKEDGSKTEFQIIIPGCLVLRARVKAIGDMPHSQYVSQLFFRECRKYHIWLLYLSRDDWFSTVGNGECSKIEVVFEEDSGLRYLSSRNPVLRCGVSLVYQANARCSSSGRVITFEGWNYVHHGFFNSKRSRDEFDD
uniref:Uncharacterized protein n=1 Tax=Quercus lobata TaxID=97700 RepID=A0A7N2M7Q0_QUELO